jgi:hypothetical protein
VEITYLTWTADGLLHHTVFVGLREDNPADQVRQELFLRTRDHRRATPIINRPNLSFDLNQKRKKYPRDSQRAQLCGSHHVAARFVRRFKRRRNTSARASIA